MLPPEVSLDDAAEALALFHLAALESSRDMLSGEKRAAGESPWFKPLTDFAGNVSNAVGQAGSTLKNVGQTVWNDPTGRLALYGAGIGGGAAAIGSLGNRRRRKNLLSNALSGAGVGALGGLAAGLGAGMLGSSPAEAAVDKANQTAKSVAKAQTTSGQSSFDKAMSAANGVPPAPAPAPTAAAPQTALAGATIGRQFGGGAKLPPGKGGFRAGALSPDPVAPPAPPAPMSQQDIDAALAAGLQDSYASGNYGELLSRMKQIYTKDGYPNMEYAASPLAASAAGAGLARMGDLALRNNGGSQSRLRDYANSLAQSDKLSPELKLHAEMLNNIGGRPTAAAGAATSRGNPLSSLMRQFSRPGGRSWGEINSAIQRGTSRFINDPEGLLADAGRRAVSRAPALGRNAVNSATSLGQKAIGAVNKHLLRGPGAEMLGSAAEVPPQRIFAAKLPDQFKAVNDAAAANFKAQDKVLMDGGRPVTRDEYIRSGLAGVDLELQDETARRLASEFKQKALHAPAPSGSGQNFMTQDELMDYAAKQRAKELTASGALPTQKAMAKSVFDAAHTSRPGAAHNGRRYSRLRGYGVPALGAALPLMLGSWSPAMAPRHISTMKPQWP